jgi:hypothetical protein
MCSATCHTCTPLHLQRHIHVVRDERRQLLLRYTQRNLSSTAHKQMRLTR